MDAGDERWKDEVLEKLLKVFEGEEEEFCRIIFFLNEEDKAYKDDVVRPYAPHWKSLKATLNNDKAFQVYAKRLADDTRRAGKDQNFREHVNTMYEQMSSHCDETVGIKILPRKFDPRISPGAISTSALSGLARAWAIIPAQSKASIVNVIRQIGSFTETLPAVDGVLGLSETAGGSIVMVGLAAVYLTYDAYNNIRRWWKGEISGKRCIKNVLDSTLTVGAGMVGSLAGAALGSLAGPVGTVVGSVFGGVIAGSAVNALSDCLTQKLFGIPKHEAEENAFRYLGVKCTASNADLNTAFRQLSLQHHPDKGGSAEEFIILQCHMAVIRQARGEC